MYKLLVVEDEEIIRNGIIRCVKWNELGYDIVGQVANGKEGLDFVRQNKPDVVLTDVRMPLMDGLEMSAQILKLYPDIKVIILSGYADFEYAQKAIRFKAFDYLLKPTDKNKFLQCFLKLKAELDRVREETLAHMQEQERLYKNLVRIRDDFLIKMMEGEMPVGALLKDSLHSLEIDFSGRGFAVGVIALGSFKEPPEENRNSRELLKSSYSNILSEHLQNGLYGLCVVKSINEIAVVFNFKDRAYSEEVAADILKKSMAAIRELISGKSVKVYAGLGLCYPDPYYIQKSYVQAKSCLNKRFYVKDTNFIAFCTTDRDACLFEHKWIEGFPEDATAAIDAALNGNTDSASELIENMFKRFEELKLSPEMVRDYAYFLCFMLYGSIMNPEIREKLPVQTDYKAAIGITADIHSLKDLVLESFGKTSGFIKESKFNNDGKNIVQNVKRYISTHYKDDITLEKLSHQFYISPSYLSYLFQYVSGESYSDYLKSTRLRKARELLENKKELKVYEVCYLVGYKEYKYFSLQFKNAFGLSPTEIRKASMR